MTVPTSEPSEKQAEEIKKAVREAYARRVTEQSGCCGPAGTPSSIGAIASSCGCGAAPGGTSPKLALYSPEQIADLPADAVENSFGCGNPLAFAGVKPGDVVLDIGSGAGIDVLIASKIVGPAGKVIGLDMTPEMIAKAWANAVETGAKNVEFRLGDAESMPVADASVDWIISNCVINLAPNKQNVFKEVARVLKPGGKVSISDIVTGDLPKEIRDSMTMWSYCIAGAVNEKDYLRIMEDAGLTDIEVTSRQVYDAVVVRAMIEDNVPDVKERGALLGFLDKNEDLANQIWSAKIVATKPL